MNKKSIMQSLQRKDGVALLMVLGIMSVLLLLGVAFGLNMRIERLVASNYDLDIRSKQLNWVAIARAMDQIETDVGNNYSPSWVAIGSSGGSAPVEDLIANDVTNFIAQALLDDARTAGAAATWLDTVASNSGQYAFTIVDMSQLLDIGGVGSAGGGVRQYGTNPVEISLASLPEIGSEGNFITTRNNYQQFETMNELYNLGRLNGGMIDYPISTMNWSKYRDEFTNRIDIGGSPSTWNSANVRTAIQRSFSGAPAINLNRYSDLIFDNLVDYVDADDIPQSLENGHVERVPMIHEVKATYGLQKQPDNTFAGGLILEYELAFPFCKNSTTAFDLRVADITINNLASSDPSLVPVSPGAHTLNNAYPVNQKQQFVTVADNPILAVGADTTNPGRANFRIELKLEVLQGGTPVDAVPYPSSAQGLIIDIDLQNIVVGANVTTNWIEGNDPRYNAEANQPLQWAPGNMLRSIVPSASPTMGATNTYTDMMFNPSKYGFTPAMITGAELDFDKDMQMHVSNEPLKTVGELGHLTFDFWRTIRLYKHGDYQSPTHADPPEFHRVYQYFKIGNNAPTRRGLINMNTEETNVLASAYVDMPLNDCEDADSWVRVTPAQASQVADMVISNGPYTNVSMLGEIEYWPDMIGGRGVSEIQAEGFIRNAAGLFGTRQNLFLIVGTGRIQPDAGGYARGERSCVALVWRDPQENSNGTHDSFIRYFQWLND